MPVVQVVAEQQGWLVVSMANVYKTVPLILFSFPFKKRSKKAERDVHTHPEGGQWYRGPLFGMDFAKRVQHQQDYMPKVIEHSHKQNNPLLANSLQSLAWNDRHVARG